MKRIALLTLMSLAILSLLFLSGCSKDSPTTPNEEVNALDEPYGGYSTADELPGFGDAEIIEEFGEDNLSDDPVAADPEFAAKLDSVNAYFIRITWGLHEFDSTATEIVDWSGNASVNKGILAVTRVIRFEQNDHLILPRSDVKVMEWISQTKVHFDGVTLVILDTDTTNTPGEFTISLPLYNRTFSFSELDSMAILEDVGTAGNQVAIVSHSKKVIPLGGGFFDGRWVRKDERGGFFVGRWINRLGTHAGHLRGIWGTNSYGANVFHGKYIDLNGRFGGLLTGRSGYAENSQTEGWMAGRWVNRSLTQIGTLKGHWVIKPDDDQHGFFQGEWRKIRP